MRVWTARLRSFDGGLRGGWLVVHSDFCLGRRAVWRFGVVFLSLSACFVHLELGYWELWMLAPRCSDANETVFSSSFFFAFVFDTWGVSPDLSIYIWIIHISDNDV